MLSISQNQGVGTYERATQVYNNAYYGAKGANDINDRNPRSSEQSTNAGSPSLTNANSDINLSNIVHNGMQLNNQLPLTNQLGVDFRNLLREKIHSIRKASNLASRAVDGFSDNDASFVNLAAAVTEASINLDEMLSVRNTLVAMWKDIMSTHL